MTPSCRTLVPLVLIGVSYAVVLVVVWFLPTSGANIGAGLMLFGAPVVYGVLLVVWITRRWRIAGRENSRRSSAHRSK